MAASGLEARMAAVVMGLSSCLIKAQIHSGARGKGGRIQMAATAPEVEEKAVEFIYNDKEKNALIAKAELEKGLATYDAELHPVAVSSENAIAAAVNRIIAAKPDLVYLPSDSFIIANANKVLPKLNAAKLQTYGAVNKLVVNGAMIGIVGGYDEVGEMLAQKVEQILTGKSPAQIPSTKLPTKLQTILVNAKTVQQVEAELPYDILSLGKILE